MTTEHVFDRYEPVRTALANPDLVPLPATGDGPRHGVEWLRATVARFCAGTPHARRRQLVERELARMDPEKLRAAAAQATARQAEATAATGLPASGTGPQPTADRPAVEATATPATGAGPQATPLGPEATAATGLPASGPVAQATALRPEATSATGLSVPGAGPQPTAALAAAEATALPATGTGPQPTAAQAAAQATALPASGAEAHLAAARTGEGGDSRAVVAVLAGGMGVADPEGVAGAVAAVAPAYFGGADAESAASADAAVAWLVPRIGGADEEEAANRIGLLVQAGDATAALIAHARRHPQAAAATLSIEDVLAETLRMDPPVRTMHRVAVRDTHIGAVAVAAGDRVRLDVAAANRDPEALARPGDFPALTFGAAPRRCPGAAHALALAAGVLGGLGEQPDEHPAEEQGPATDERDPAEVVAGMVAHVLDVAATWTAWDGNPVPSEDRIYTPHKAIRRTADHLLDHLAELEARLVGEEPEPDHWHASATTTPLDLAPFTTEDLEEARSRLVRLARMWSQRLGALSQEQLDHSPGHGWSFRQLAFHLEGSTYYADAVGRLPGGAA
jgi:hypothetical protein